MKNTLNKTTYRLIFFAIIFQISALQGFAQFFPDSTDNFSYQLASYQTYLDSLDSITRYADDGEETQFQRWNHYWRQRIGINGKFSTYLQNVANNNNSAFKTEMTTCPEGGDWRQVGPFKMPCEDKVSVANYPTGVGRMNKVVLDPGYASNGIIYALANGGSLYKSTDRGAHWRDMTMGKIDRVGAYDLAVNPLRNKTIYLATGNGDNPNWFWTGINSSGLYVSYDGGESWQPTCLAYPAGPCGLQNNIPIAFQKPPFSPSDMRQITRVLIHPTDTGHLLVSTFHLNDYRLGGGGAVLKSTNGGRDWTESITGFFRDMKTHPTNPDIIYAAGGRFNTGIFRSTDQGDTWTESIGLPLAQSHFAVPYSSGCDGNSPPNINYPFRIDLAVSPNPLREDNVYAHVHYISGNNCTPIAEIYRSTDSGATWSLVTSGEAGTDFRNAFAVDFSQDLGGPDGELYYFGKQWLRKKRKGGNQVNATNVSAGLDGIHYAHADYNHIQIFKLPNGSAEFYLATDGGVFRRTAYANGQTDFWEGLNDGLAAVEYYSVSSSPFDEEQLICGAQDAGLYFYNHGGWFGLHEYGDGTSTYASKTTPGELSGATQGVGPNLTQQQTQPSTLPADCATANMGLSSKSYPPGQKGDFRVPFATDATDPNFLWAPVEGPPGSFFLINRSGSTNWSNAGTIAAPNFGAGKEYLPTILEMGKATTPNAPTYIYVGKVTADPTAQGAIPSSSATWMGGAHASNQLYVSTDNGSSWADISPTTDPGLGLNDIVIDPVEPNKVWAVFPDGCRVAFSPDAGKNWYNLTVGASILPKVPVFSVAIDPRNGTLHDAIYLGTDVGCYYRDNTLADWVCYNKGFPYAIIQDLEIAPTCGMIRAATFGRSLWESPLRPLPTAPYNVQPNALAQETWAVPHYMDTDLIIPTGKTLTISSTLYMASGTQIKVRRGAKLIVDGGKITSRALCIPSMMWQGIFVEGDPAKPQTAIYQGTVILKNNAIIEDARNAVSTSKLAPDGGTLWTHMGGIVQATNSTFRNNLRAVEFLTYHNTFVNPNSETPNLSYFKDCIFETTALLKDYQLSPSFFATLLGVYGVKFTRNTFINRIPAQFDALQKGGGIFALDADFTIDGFCASPLPNGGCNSWDGNVFKNLNNGIHLTSTQLNPQYSRVQGNAFINCKQAIIVEGVDYDAIKENTIKVDGAAPADFPFFTGIYALKANGFRISDNVIDMSAAVGKPTWGVVTNKTSTSLGSRLYRNQIVGTMVAYQSELQNRMLWINCNTMTNNGKDFRIFPYDPNCTFCPPPVADADLPNQGSGPTFPNFPFGYDPKNAFDATCSNGSTDHIGQYGLSNSYSYFCSSFSNRHPDPFCSSPIPISNVNVTLPQSAADPCTAILSVGNSLAEMSKQYQQNAIQLEAMIDGGETALLLSRINQTPPMAVQDLFEMLQARSPYLSDEVMIALIHRDAAMPSDRLRDLLIPNAQLSNAVMDALSKRIPALSPAEQLEILAAQTQVSARTQLERGIGHLQTLSGAYLSEYIRYLMDQDTIAGPMADSLMQSLDADGTDASTRLLASYLNLQGDFQAAQDKLLHLDPSDAYNTTFSVLQGMLIDLNRNGRALASLTPIEKQMLLGVATAESQVGLQAKNMLDWVNGTLTHERIPMDLPESSQKLLDPQQSNATNSTFLEQFMIYPNPNAGKFTVEWHLQDVIANQRVEFYSVEGKKIAEFSLSSNLSGKQELDLSSLVNGLYFYRFSHGDNTVSSGKLLIQH